MTEKDVYTHGHSDAVLRSHRSRTAANSAAYLVPSLEAGMRLLDVGCGPGTLTADLARLVAPAEVIGVDVSADVVAEATAFAAEAGIDNVSFRAGDIRDAGLEPASFDVVHAHQVLQHVSDPVGVLVTMKSLARPGGIVAARDSIYSSFGWYPTDPRLDRWLEVYLAVTKRNGADADAGTRLLAWAKAAGLKDITASSSTWTWATTDTRRWWGELWADRTVGPGLGTQAVEYGIATIEELEDIAAAWRSWSQHDDGTFVVVHGEVLARA